MKKRKIASLLVLAASVVAFTGCGKDKSSGKKTYANNAIGYEKGTTYKAFYSYDPETLNYLVSFKGEDQAVFANLVDGLVENDNYGRIVPSLAESWTISEDGLKWTFNIREGVKWVKNNGTVYADVTANDWVTSAQYVLNPASASQTYYLLTDEFIAGADEYYCALEYKQLQAGGADETALARSCWNTHGYAGELNLETAANFASVGVKAIDNYTLEYTLKQPAVYFSSVLTYAPYFPVNKAFIEEVGFDNFGTSETNFLYNGAYRLKTYQLTSLIELQANDKYWDKDNVHIKTVSLIKYPDSMSDYSYARTQYEAGEIDGFRVNANDTTGWKKYVTGSSSRAGTAKTPASDIAYSTEGTGDGSSYVLFFNQVFDPLEYVGKHQNFKTTLNETEIANAAKAMANNNFRKALTYGLNRNYFHERYFPEGYENRSQYMINTYTPYNFVSDDAGNDYLKYYAAEYAKNEVANWSTLTEEQQAAKVEEIFNKLTPSQDFIYDADKAGYYLNLAKQELQAQGVTFPVKLEYLGLWQETEVAYNNDMIKRWNADLKAAAGSEVIEIVRNSAVQGEYDYLYGSNYGVYHLCTSGWGADYGDPLTYLATLTSTGAFASFAGVNADEMASYDALVAAAAEKQNISERYEAFAKAEYDLIYNKNVMVPLYMAGLGTNVSVSKIVPYTAKKAMYGSSADKYKGMIVAKDAVNQATRNYLKGVYDGQKDFIFQQDLFAASLIQKNDEE